MSKTHLFLGVKSAYVLAREHLSSHDSLKDAWKTKSYNEVETIEAKTKTCGSGSAKHPCEEGQDFLNIEWENNNYVVKAISAIKSSQEREYEDEWYEELHKSGKITHFYGLIKNRWEHKEKTRTDGKRRK